MAPTIGAGVMKRRLPLWTPLRIRKGIAVQPRCDVVTVVLREDKPLTSAIEVGIEKG